MSGPVPQIDISPLLDGSDAAKNAVARVIEAACTDTGFFTVVGHGIDVDLLARTRRAAESFFAAPDSVKNRVLRPPEKISRGWNPPEDRSLANTLGEETPPDLQEAWAMGPPVTGTDDYCTRGAGVKFFEANRWPEVPDFREILESYYKAMTGLSHNMLRGFALALGLNENFFAARTDRPCSIIRLVRYPAQPTAPLPGQLRAGAHSDYGSFTFVKGDNVPGGLQVSDGAGGWRDVEAPENGFVCNIGDTMQRWTGGRFRSTLHRVVNPPPDAARQDRISLVYFHLPNHDAVLGGIGGEVGTDAPTFAEHYFGKMVKAAKSGDGGSSATAAELVTGDAAE
ncbi:MAG: isopenicillin N synthase family dioxygenase [Alphaproteobacteria bacterium]